MNIDGKAKFVGVFFLCVVLVVLGAVATRYLLPDRREAIHEFQARVGLFGAVHYFSVAQPDKGHLIVFAAAGESASQRRELARRWADKGYVTSVIEPAFLSAQPSCIDLAGPILELQHAVEQRFPNVQGLLPLVMGRGEGAALSFIALAQAPAKTFHGGIAVDFCPTKPLAPVFCPQRAWAEQAGALSAPTQALGANFYVFQTPALTASKCDTAASEQFLQSIASVKLSFSQPQNDDWLEVDALLNWLDPRLTGQALSGQNEDDSPVVEVPASEQNKKADYFVVFLTGDGGWAQLDKEVAQHFNTAGVSVLGFDSLSYFWRKRSVDETAAAISELIALYQGKWQAKQVVLVGYSFGADVLPFVVASLPKEQQAVVKKMIFLGLSKFAHFEFYLTNWLSSETRESEFSTVEKLASITSISGVCVQGAEDDESICQKLRQDNIEAVTLPGDHHYDEDYDKLAQVIFRSLDTPANIQAMPAKP
ncbi:MAG TPA: AcvB/VirJ family lysyl-phosphatidylglycerol hydrolase [Cellvibrionaceae bacterium]